MTIRNYKSFEYIVYLESFENILLHNVTFQNISILYNERSIQQLTILFINNKNTFNLEYINKKFLVKLDNISFFNTSFINMIFNDYYIESAPLNFMIESES